MAHKKIYYSEKYYDNEFEYRHVVLPKELVKLVPKNHLLTEPEWRDIGVQQSEGWIHYMTHEPGIHLEGLSDYVHSSGGHVGDIERDLLLVWGMCPDSSSGRAPARKAGDLSSDPGPEPHILLFKRKITTPPPKDAC